MSVYLNPQTAVVDQRGIMSLSFYLYLLSLQNGTGATYAPVNASYITTSSNATLTAERVLTAGANITLTDGGPGSTLTIAASGGGSSTPDYSTTFLFMGA